MALGRRLKGAGQTRNVEEEQPPAAWGPGETGESAWKKDVLEPGSAASRAQGGKDGGYKLKCHAQSIISMPLPKQKRKRFSIILLLCCSVGLCVILSACFYQRPRP